MNNKNIQNLPEELMLDSLFKLNVKDINSLCKSNKKIKAICDKNKDYIYRKLLERDFLIKLSSDSKNAKVLYYTLLTFSENLPLDYILEENHYFALLKGKLNPEIIFDVIVDDNVKLFSQLLTTYPELLDLKYESNNIIHFILKSDISEQSQIAMINTTLDINEKKVYNMIDTKNKSNETGLILFTKYIKDSPSNLFFKFLSSTKNINQQDNSGNTAFIYYMKSPNPSNLIYLEFVKKADVTLINKKGNTVFTYAIKSGNYIIIRDLFDKYFKNHLDHKNEQGQTYLHKAAKYFQVDTLELLLSKKPSLVNEVDYGKDSALHAITWQDQDIIHTIPDNVVVNTYESLIINGANTNAQNKSGRTPFMNFVYHFSSIHDTATFTTILTLFKENGANFDLKDENGYNILHYYLSSLPGSYEYELLLNLEGLLGYLLDKHLYSLDREGNTPLSWFMKKIYPKYHLKAKDNPDVNEFFDEILDIFKNSSNYNLNFKDRQGRTIKQFLIENVSDFDLKTLDE